MLRTLFRIALLGVLIALAVNAAPLIYGSAYVGSTGPATLYRISPVNGAATAIGPIGFARVGSLDFSPNGTLYGVGSNGSTTVLITINTTTGAGTQVGSMGIANNPFQDIAFRPSDGTLFGYASGSLYTINTATGLATLVGPDGLGFPDGNGISFLGSTLYYANQTALYTLNQSTGAATAVVSMTYPAAFGSTENEDRPPAMKFDHTTGILWAIVVNGTSDSAQQFSLATINIGTGVATFIGATQTGLDGLAIAQNIAPPTVPALTPSALVALAILLGALTLIILRSSQPCASRLS